jgi:hypothetical protein
LRAGPCASTQKCATAHRGSRPTRERHVGWASVLCRRTADSEFVGEAFGVEPADELHGDVDVSICSAGNNRRGQVVALNDSQSVAAPAKSDANMGLGRKSNRVGVNSDEQNHIARPFLCATDSERRNI